MPRLAVAADDGKLQIFALLAKNCRFEGVGELSPAAVRNDLTQTMANQLRGTEFTRFEAATVGVTDKTGRVRHHDHALGVVQDLDIKVALALQLCLHRLLFGD